MDTLSHQAAYGLEGDGGLMADDIGMDNVDGGDYNYQGRMTASPVATFYFSACRPLRLLNQCTAISVVSL